MAIPVIINKGAPCIPSDLRPRLCQSRLLRNIGKCPVAIVPIECILSVISHEQVVVAVIIVIADAACLSPAGFMFQAGTYRCIRKGPIAIVLEQMAPWFLPRGKTFKTPAIYKKEIYPPIVIIVIKGKPAARCFQKILVSKLSAIDGLRIQASLRGHIHKAYAKRRAFNGRFWARWRRCRLCIVTTLLRPDLLGGIGRCLLLKGRSQGKDIRERKHQGCAAERTDEGAAFQ